MARLKFAEFCAQLQKGSPGPLYVLAGEETFYRREALAALKRRLFGLAPGERPPAGAVCVLAGSRASPAEVLDEVATRGFFAESRLVVVEEGGAFLRAHKVGAEFVERVRRVAGPSVLVLVVSALDGRSGFARSALRAGAVVDCGPLAKRAASGELRAWVRKRAARHGLGLERGAEAVLVERVGTSLDALEQELIKLALFVGERGRASAADIESLVGRNRELEVYELTDAVLRGDRGRALGLAGELLRRGMVPPVLVGALGAQFRRLWHVRHRLAAGAPPGEACREAGIRQPFLWERTAQAARSRSDEQLARALRLIARADTVIKGQTPTALPDDLAVESLVVRLCLVPEAVAASNH